jgi:hypothetical protein
MGISASLVLIAAGAILKWAATATTSGINLGTVGVVLMIVGAVGLLLSLVFWSSWAGSAVAPARRRPWCATSRPRFAKQARGTRAVPPRASRDGSRTLRRRCSRLVTRVVTVRASRTRVSSRKTDAASRKHGFRILANGASVPACPTRFCQVFRDRPWTPVRRR